MECIFVSKLRRRKEEKERHSCDRCDVAILKKKKIRRGLRGLNLNPADGGTM